MTDGDWWEVCYKQAEDVMRDLVGCGRGGDGYEWVCLFEILLM